MQAISVHPRPGGAKLPDDRGKCVARLGVRRGDAQGSLVALRIVFGQPADVAQLQQGPLDHRDQFLAGRGQAQQALAASDE
jgi:hypothetical protein